MRAGDMRDRLQFEKRSDTDDGYGNSQATFSPQFQCWGQIMPQRGTEQAMDSRLQGIQPMVIRVRLNSDTQAIATDWQVRDLRTDAVYAIKSVVDPTRRREFLEITATSGIAA